MMTDCPGCDGEGRVTKRDRGTIEMGPSYYRVRCCFCNGTGRVMDTMKCRRCGEDLLVSDEDNGFCSVCREECHEECESKCQCGCGTPTIRTVLLLREQDRRTAENLMGAAMSTSPMRVKVRVVEGHEKDLEDFITEEDHAAA